nr:MAG TPA: hypothetical protein [Caudoviricetes sp.]
MINYMTKAIHDKDYNLLIHSEVIKLHPELMDIIHNTPQIHMEELEDKNSDYHRFMKNVYPRILSDAISEWDGAMEQDIKQVEKKQQRRCDICGANIVNICTIHNKLNKKKLYIGTDCNVHFGIVNKKDIESSLKKQNELRRLNKLDKKFPNITGRIKEWKDVLNNTELYLPNKISGRYIVIGEEIAELYKEYTKTKNITQIREDAIIQKMDMLFKEGETEKAVITEFIINNQGKLLYPTKNMMSSIKNQSSYNRVVKSIEEDTTIKLRTLLHFRDYEFAEKLIPIINNILDKKEFKVISARKISNKKVGYDIKLTRNNRCSFYIDYELICSMFGAEIINSNEENLEEYDIDRVINYMELIDINSIDYAISIIDFLVRDKDIELVEYYPNFDEVIWKVTKEDSDKPKFFYITKVKQITNYLKDIIINTKKYNADKLYGFIRKKSEKLNNGDAYDIIKSREL